MKQLDFFIREKPPRQFGVWIDAPDPKTGEIPEELDTRDYIEVKYTHQEKDGTRSATWGPYKYRVEDLLRGAWKAKPGSGTGWVSSYMLVK